MKRLILSIVLLAGCRAPAPTPASWVQTGKDTWVYRDSRSDIAEIVFDGVVYWSFRNHRRDIVGADATLEAAEARAGRR